jgi:hypothetical protein
MKRRGIVLVITLMVASIISMSAVTLYYMARDDMAIAGNMRRISKTKMAATSGIQHFQAMNLFYNNILDLGGGSDPLNIIPETNLAPGLSYKVDVSLCCDLGANRFRVISTGFYKKRQKIISSQVVHAIMETQ